MTALDGRVSEVLSSPIPRSLSALAVLAGLCGLISCGGDGSTPSTSTSLPEVQVSPSPSPSSSPTPVTYASFVAGSTSSTACLITPSGQLWCWGDNRYQQLGTSVVPAVSWVPRPISLGGTVVAASVGADFACAALSDGTARCWGNNAQGQLGNGTTLVAVGPQGVQGLNGNVLALASGQSHTCALIQGGTVQCWGVNTYGQLGNGGTSPSTKAVAVSGLTGAIAVSAGFSHSCALVAGGAVECWGRNNALQLGNGTSTQLSPVSSVAGSSFTRLVSGGYSNCGLTTQGQAQCWGRGLDGELGNGHVVDSSTAVTVSGLAHAVSLSMGDYHACALSSDQTVSCWGKGSSGELGNGGTSSESTPAALEPLSGGTGTIEALGTGVGFGCVSLEDQSVQCWGDGQYGVPGKPESFTVPVARDLPTKVGLPVTGSPAELLFSGGPALDGLTGSTCYAVELLASPQGGGYGTGIPVAVQVDLTTGGTLQFYSDSACANAVSTVTAAAGQSTVTVYVQEPGVNATYQETLQATASGGGLSVSDSLELYISNL